MNINVKIDYQLLNIEWYIPLFQPLQYHVQEHLKGNKYVQIVFAYHKVWNT